MIIAAYPGSEYEPHPGPIDGVIWVDDKPWASHVLKGPDKDLPHEVASFLGKLSRAHDGAKVVPLRDVVVLPAAHANDVSATGGLTLHEALAAEHRLYFRRAVERHAIGYSMWYTSKPAEIDRWPIVVKQAGSSASEGVRVCKNQGELNEAFEVPYSEATRVIMDFAPSEAYVFEEFVEGYHWEVSGVASETGIKTFGVLEQIWDKPGGKIVEYKAVRYPDEEKLLADARTLVYKLGLRWCAFNVEFISTKKRPIRTFAIEVNARLGWDPAPYSKLLMRGERGGTQPDQFVMEWLAKEDGTSSQVDTED